MIRTPFRRPSSRGPRHRALQARARIAANEASHRPLDTFKGVADPARELADARHTAVAVVDSEGYIEDCVANRPTAEQEREPKSALLVHGQLGSRRKDALSVRTDDLEAHNASIAFPPKRPTQSIRR